MLFSFDNSFSFVSMTNSISFVFLGIAKFEIVSRCFMPIGNSPISIVFIIFSLVLITRLELFIVSSPMFANVISMSRDLDVLFDLMLSIIMSP